ncbi:MAG: hypothetical protein RJA36_3423 [Pseudomonadota bacterium]|jgi:arsenite-transporting ATPase
MRQSRATKSRSPALATLVDEIAADGHGLVMLMGKGGVGKTTLAAAIAVALAHRGLPVHLTTSDPAGHLAETLEGCLDQLTVSRIDPHTVTERYRQQVLATKGARLDATGVRFTTSMMQLQDPTQTKVLIVTLAETTPVLEAANLQADLKRAGTEPWAWVINNSLAAGAPQSALLHQRAINELHEIERGVARHSRRHAGVPLGEVEPVGIDRLLGLTAPSRQAEPRSTPHVPASQPRTSSTVGMRALLTTFSLMTRPGVCRMS